MTNERLSDLPFMKMNYVKKMDFQLDVDQVVDDLNSILILI